MASALHIILNYFFPVFPDAMFKFCSGNFTVSGPKATAGIFATYPAPYISIHVGFLDQVSAAVLACHGHMTQWQSRNVIHGTEYILAVGPTHP